MYFHVFSCIYPHFPWTILDLSSLFSHLLGRPFIRAVVAPAPRRTEVLPPRAGRPAAAAGRQGAAAEDAHGLGPTGALRDARWTNLQLLEVVCYEKFTYRHTGRTHTHTLAQKHLIELLMWNASDVQKTPQ